MLGILAALVLRNRGEDIFCNSPSASSRSSTEGDSNQISAISQLIGATAAIVAGGGADEINQGASIAQSAALNNYLTHEQVNEFERKYGACRVDAKCKVAIYNAYLKLSAQNSKALRDCGIDNSCVGYHLEQIAKAAVTADEFWGGKNSGWGAGTDTLHGLGRHTLSMIQKADLKRAVSTYRTNAVLTNACPGLDGGCISRYKLTEIGKAVLSTIADFSPVIGDGKAFYEAYKSGSKLDWAMAIIGLIPALAMLLSRQQKPDD